MTEVNEAETHDEIEYAYTDIEIGHVLDKNLKRFTMTEESYILEGGNMKAFDESQDREAVVKI